MKGIHSTEESSKAVHNWESTEAAKCGSGLKVSRRTSLYEKSKKYFARKAIIEKTNQVSCKAHKTILNTRKAYTKMMESTGRHRRTKRWRVLLIVTVMKKYY